MSENLKLVEHFISELFGNNVKELKVITSPEFEYYLNSDPKQNFTEFVERVEFIQKSTKVTVGDFSAIDSDNYYLDFEMVIPKITGEDAKAFGRVDLCVVEGLVRKVALKYSKSKVEFNRFQKLRRDSPVVLL